MKVMKALTLSLFVVVAMVVGSGAAIADPGPKPVDLTVPLFTPLPDGSNSQVAQNLFPENNPKQDAFDTMTEEINTGWQKTGIQGVMIGSNVGMAIGCVSIFPNFIAGCILGTIIGAGVGAVAGIGYGNPEAQPAVEKFLATP